MKKFTNVCSSSLFLVLLFTSMLFFSSCSSNKQYFSFTPAPPAYVKKQTSAVVTTTPAKTDNSIPDNTITNKVEAVTDNASPSKTNLTASATSEHGLVLPEVAALTKSKVQPSALNVNENKTKQKLTLAQKVVLHKVQKQVKKLGNQAQAAAGPVSNRNAIALVLIGIVLAVFATLIGGGLGNLFYTLGILVLLVGLILLILNYV